jgi:hypothetical protein
MIFSPPKRFVGDYAIGDNTDGAQDTYVVEKEYIRSVL